MTKVLLTGPPGSGKTTLVRSIVHALQGRNEQIGGFITSEIRRGGRRTGFTISGIDSGLERLMAVRGGAGPQVGSYGVDVDAFESVALLEIESALELGLTLVVDEIGKMELLSARFRELVPTILDAENVLATIHAHADPITDALIRRADIRLIRLPLADQAAAVDRIASILSDAPRYSSR